MKKIILSVLIAIITTTFIYPQAEKGTFALGGSISIEKNTDQNTSTIGLAESNTERILLSPYVGYFTSENLMIGLGLEYNTYKYEYEVPELQSITQTDNTFIVGPFIKYYWHFSDDFSLFGRVLAVIGFGNSENSTTREVGLPRENKTEYDVSVMGASLNPGVSYNINNWIGLEASLGVLSYIKNTYKITESDDSENQKNDSNSFNFNINLNSINIGIQLSL